MGGFLLDIVSDVMVDRLSVDNIGWIVSGSGMLPCLCYVCSLFPALFIFHGKLFSSKISRVTMLLKYPSEAALSRVVVQVSLV